MMKNAVPVLSMRIIDFDETNMGLKFSYHEMDDIPKRVPVVVGKPAAHVVGVNDESTCGIAEMSVGRNGLFASLTVYGEKKKLFEELIIKNLVPRPYGFGRIVRDEVREFNLICLYLDDEHDTGFTH